jgi:hypothetical protein
MDHYQDKLDSFSKFKNNKNNFLNSDKKLGFRKLAAIQGIHHPIDQALLPRKKSLDPIAMNKSF